MSTLERQINQSIHYIEKRYCRRSWIYRVRISVACGLLRVAMLLSKEGEGEI